MKTVTTYCFHHSETGDTVVCEYPDVPAGLFSIRWEENRPFVRLRHHPEVPYHSYSEEWTKEERETDLITTVYRDIGTKYPKWKVFTRIDYCQ